MNNPEITAIMLTCGRIKWIGDSIESFYKQTYPNKKLLIIDTHPSNISFKIPLPLNVSYIKCKSKDFKTLGEKTLYALSLVKSDFTCMWEDDDVWLSHHLESCVKRIPVEVSDIPLRIGHDKCFYLEGDGESIPFRGNITDGLWWCRYIFGHKDGHWQNAKDNPFDAHYMRLNFKDIIFTDESPSYIYRWNNSQSHMSGFYDRMNHEEVYRFFEDAHSKENICDSVVDISWKIDYQSICNEILKNKI